MACISVGGRVFEADLVVFDKDGTLVDFDRLWSGKLRKAVERVIAAMGGREALKAPLFATLGIDAQTLAVIPESPLAVSTLPKLSMACTVVLYQQGISWHEAERITRAVFIPAIEALPEADDLAPFGDLPALMGALQAQDCRVAILTSDDRAATQAALPLLGIAGLVDDMVCGDDPLPSKPHPEGLLRLSDHLGVPPPRVMMVGDSITDMRTARAAGIGAAIAVTSGTGSAEALSAHADLVVADVSAITVL